MADEKTIITERKDTIQEPMTSLSAGVTIVPMKAWQIVLVRVARVYVQSLLGFLTSNLTGLTDVVIAQATDVQLPAMAFWAKLVLAASMAVAPAAFTLLQNTGELLAKLDSTNPRLRA